jgi:hypothetical protein
MRITHKSLIVASVFRVTALLPVIINHRESEGTELWLGAMEIHEHDTV